MTLGVSDVDVDVDVDVDEVQLMIKVLYKKSIINQSMSCFNRTQ